MQRMILGAITLIARMPLAGQQGCYPSYWRGKSAAQGCSWCVESKFRLLKKVYLGKDYSSQKGVVCIDGRKRYVSEEVCAGDCKAHSPSSGRCGFFFRCAETAALHGYVDS